MTLEDMKTKVYSLIEEYDEDADELTTDDDFAAKMNTCINMIQNELVRYKKINAKKTLEVKENDEKTLQEIADDMYQLNIIKGVDYEVIGDTVEFKEDGTAKIYYYKYPEQIKNDTEDYTFELDDELLEIMPYGVAGLVLASDVSNNYGKIYTDLYREKLQMIDSRKATLSVTITGGLNL